MFPNQLSVSELATCDIKCESDYFTWDVSHVTNVSACEFITCNMNTCEQPGKYISHVINSYICVPIFYFI